MIVRHDADVQRATAMAVGILSVNAGQGCAITTRLLVHNSIRPTFAAMAAAMAAHIKIGDAADPSVTMGPLICESQRAKVEHYVALGKAAGATHMRGSLGNLYAKHCVYLPIQCWRATRLQPDCDLSIDRICGDCAIPIMAG